MVDSTRRNALDPKNDIGGTDPVDQASNLDLLDESAGLGPPITGQTGATASITAFGSNLLTLTGLTGMVNTQSESLLILSGAANAGNNGIFTIVNYHSATSVDVYNENGVFPDANSGAISWEQREPYTLATDLNYERTDRALIKGVPYDTNVAPYTRPSATGTPVLTNLTNISGKTTDAIAYPGSREFFGATVISGQSKITITDVGELKHTDTVNTLGIPCFDVAPFVGDFRSCFVKILDGDSSGGEFVVLGGIHQGERIFGVTNNGSSVSPDSVEILFYSCPMTGNIETDSTPYTWEVGQPNSINVVYGYNQRMDGFDFNIFRFDLTLPNGTSGGGSGLTPNEHQTLRQLIHFMNEGPANGFLSGAYKEILPTASPFPTSIIWYESNTKAKKIVEKTYTYNANKTPATIAWAMYATDGITVIATVSDAITYQGVFETSRTRSIS